MITLQEPPGLVAPTMRVQTSFLVGEQADCVVRGGSADWLADASADFANYVAGQRAIRARWGVPSTILWYVSGVYYLGALVIRHELTEELADAGGNIGYHVVTPWQRQGHATRMLAEGLDRARTLNLSRVLLTCGPDNIASRRVIMANGGRPDGRRRGEDRFWIDLD